MPCVPAPTRGTASICDGLWLGLRHTYLTTFQTVLAGADSERDRGACPHSAPTWRRSARRFPAIGPIRLFLSPLCLICPYKVEAGGVNAIALSGRARAIVEDMPEMAAAATASDLDPVHAIAEILKRLDGRRVNVVE